MEGRRLSRQALRKKAVGLYKNNWKIPEICATLGCSRTWFYKWLNRYDASDTDWYKGESRKPRSSGTKVDQRTEQLVLDTREQLMSSPYSQYGPKAIYYLMLQKGYTAPPVWTLEGYFGRLKQKYRQHRGMAKHHHQAYFLWYFHLCPR